MRLLKFIILLLSIAAVFAEEQKKAPEVPKEPAAAQPERKKQLNEAQVSVIAEKVMQSDLTGKTPDEVKEMIKAEIKKEQEKNRAPIYHHIHRSVEDAEDVDVEEHVAGDAIALGKKKGIFEMRHELNRIEDEEEAKKARDLKPVDPETAELQAKYEKILKAILKEKSDANQPKPTQLELIKEVEKRMKEKQKKHPVKSSDRMIAYMEELLSQLNGGTLKNADKFDMKGFVSSVFGRYREKHEATKERKRRILALKEHLARMNRDFGHHSNFNDEFYTPHERGYDTNFHMRPLPPKRDPNLQPVLVTSVLNPPDRLGLSQSDREKYFGYEHHSDHQHLPLNMPMVAPDNSAMDFLDSLGLDKQGEIKVTDANEGFLRKAVNSIKKLFEKGEDK